MPSLPFVPFTDCVEAVVQGVNSAVAAYLTLGFKFAGPPSPTDIDDLAGVIETWYHDEVQPNLTAEVAFNAVKITDLSSISAPVANYAFTPPNDGSVSGAGVSNQDAMVVTFNTALRGRSYRGRNYVPGLPVAARVNGTLWTTTVCGVWNGVYLNLQTAAGGIGWTHVVLSRYANLTRRTTGVATPVVSYRANPPIGTQRRRIIGHGI